MSMLSTALEAISDFCLLITIIYTVYIIQYNLLMPLSSYKVRIITALVILCFVSIFFSQNFFKRLAYLEWLLIILNFSKYILLTAFIYKKLLPKSIMFMIIIQFMPTTVTTGLLTLAPEKLVDYRLFNIILLFAVRLIVFAGIILIKNKIDYSSIQTLASVIPNYVYFLIILVLFLSEGLNQTSNYITSNIEQKIELIKILSSLQTICTTVIILSLLFNVISKKYQSDINTVLEKQIATQLYHYEQLEKMNAETRRFKHDYINHMKCISYMALNQEYDNILNYIGKLSAAFPTSSFLFETGNYIADAILTEKQVSSPDNISIQFDGVIPTDIDNTDLCIILSNAVDNAVEACCLLGGDKIINVYGGFKHGYFVFKIKNPTVNTNLNGKITTTKSDKINHGFGLDNIKRALKKYDGYLSTSCEDNVFTLNITFSGLSDLPPKTRENNSAEAEKVEK